MTTSSRTEPERDLGRAVDAAVVEGLSLLDALAAETETAYVAALAEVDAAVAAHRDAPGTDVLVDFQRSLKSLRHDASERLRRQQGRLATFNLVMFGRTGAGKSSLIEALSGGSGAPISQGESDWTTDVREVCWGSCRLFDTPGIAGWGRTVARSELEARAEAAVADADVVLLCFDTQSQQEGEFGKVAEWIARYGKPAVAVLNSRNGRWRFPLRVSRPSARRQLSRSVQEHATNIRDELSNIGLADVPVVAVHSKRAAFARTSDPYEGPDAASRHKLRDEVGPERLLAWSNLPALESLLAAALTEHAEELRLGMLREQARGLLRSSVEEISEQHNAPARLAAEQLERGVADVLALLGRPSTEPFAKKLEMLETLRGGGFAASAVGEAEHHTRTRLSSRLRGPRARTIRRAEQLVEQAFTERRDADLAQFEQQILKPAIAEVEAVARELGSEISEFLTQRLELIAGDVIADLAAAMSEFSGARGSAGRRRRQWGIGAEVTAGVVAVGTGGYMIAAVVIASVNPITLPIGIAIGAAGLAMKLFGGKLRKQAASKREQALATARAEARRSVIDTFDGMEVELAHAFTSSFATSAAEQLGDQVDRAMALRRLGASADQAAAALLGALDHIAPGGSSAHVLSDTAHLLQRTIYPGAPNAERLIWLGEDWCADPDGLELEAAEAERARTTAYDLRRSERLMERMRRFARRASVRPRPGAGLEWLAAAHDQLAGDPQAVQHLQAADELARDGRPQIVIAGDYSSGKSSFVKRLLVDAGEVAPEELDVGAHPVTDRAATFAWGDWNLVDTPGFQSSNVEHADEAHQAIVGAAVVVLLFNANLVVGDRSDLAAVLAGNEVSGRVGKVSRTLFVVNRADELGVDPRDDLPAFEALCARKELELRQAIASISPSGKAIDVAEDQLLCTASDPYGMVGDEKEIASGVYDEHRDWDGMDAFHVALRQVTRDVMRNGVDVGVLEAGAAHLGELIVDRRDELAASLDRSAQQQRLLLDLDACLLSGRAIRESARDKLIATFVEIVARMYDDVSLTTESATRTARIERLESWSRDPEVEQRYREWSAGVASELSAWRASTAERVERRLNSASFRTAFPGVEEALDVEHLRPPDANNVAAAGKTVGKQSAQAAGSASRETVTKVAHQLGQKFRPWGATKLTSKINVAGGALGVVLGAWDLYATWKSLRKEDKSEAVEREVRGRVLSEVRKAAEEFFDSDDLDSAASTIDADLEVVEAVREDVKQRLERTEWNELQLRARIELCDAEIQKALGAL